MPAAHKDLLLDIFPRQTPIVLEWWLFPSTEDDHNFTILLIHDQETRIRTCAQEIHRLTVARNSMEQVNRYSLKKGDRFHLNATRGGASYKHVLNNFRSKHNDCAASIFWKAQASKGCEIEWRHSGEDSFWVKGLQLRSWLIPAVYNTIVWIISE